MSDQHQDAIATAKDMTAALNDLSLRLAKTDRRSWRTIAAVAVDLVLTVVSAVAIILAVHSGASVSQVRASSIAACRQNNQTRASEIHLWTHAFALALKAHPTAKERAADERLIAFIEGIFKPRNCESLYRP